MEPKKKNHMRKNMTWCFLENKGRGKDEERCLMEESMNQVTENLVKEFRLEKN